MEPENRTVCTELFIGKRQKAEQDKDELIEELYRQIGQLRYCNLAVLIACEDVRFGEKNDADFGWLPILTIFLNQYNGLIRLNIVTHYLLNLLIRVF